MFQVQAPVVIVPSAEVRAALGPELRAAAKAAWCEIARRGEGLEMAHFQIVHSGVTLAVSSRIRRNGFFEIGLDLGDPRLAGRIISEVSMRRAEGVARNRTRQQGQGRK